MMADKPQAKLRFLCFGIGAIGTYIGGSLLLSGQRVVFVERPWVAKNIHNSGLKLKRSTKEELISEPEVVSSIDEALTRGPFDVAIFAVKSYDTQTLVDSLVPYTVALPSFLCLQNGVGNEAILANAFGDTRVIPGTVTTAISKRGAGDVVVERLRGMGVAATHPLSATLVDVLNCANLRASLYPNPAGMKWSKMLTNLLANASSAILDMTPAQIFNHPGLYRLEILQLRESLKVMAAQKIPVCDLPATPVRAMALIAKSLPIAISRPLLARAVGRGRGEKMPSFHVDLYGGSEKSEVGYLNGAVVRAGDRLGVATPVNRLLNLTLQSLVDHSIPKYAYAHQPEKLLALL